MQIRLDDDTAAFVAERKARDGGSLSKAANALLREYATGYPLGHAIFNQRAVIEAENAAEVDRLDDDRYEMTIAAARNQPMTTEVKPHQKTYRSPANCPHPLLRRVGSQCAACGATLK